MLRKEEDLDKSDMVKVESRSVYKKYSIAGIDIEEQQGHNRIGHSSFGHP